MLVQNDTCSNNRHKLEQELESQSLKCDERNIERVICEALNLSAVCSVIATIISRQLMSVSVSSFSHTASDSTEWITSSITLRVSS